MNATAFDGVRQRSGCLPRFGGVRHSSPPSCARMYSRSNALIRDWYPRPWPRNQASTSASRRRVTCSFFGSGRRPRRATARANCSGVGSGMSVSSISWSSSSRSLFQSVLESVEEGEEIGGCFAVGFAGMDDSNGIFGFRIARLLWIIASLSSATQGGSCGANALLSTIVTGHVFSRWSARVLNMRQTILRFKLMTNHQSASSACFQKEVAKLDRRCIDASQRRAKRVNSAKSPGKK